MRGEEGDADRRQTLKAAGRPDAKVRLPAVPPRNPREWSHYCRATHQSSGNRALPVGPTLSMHQSVRRRTVPDAKARPVP